MTRETKVLIRFIALQVTYWCGYAAMPAYIGAFLLSKGISNTLLSLLIALYMLCAFAGQFFWGSMCDRLHTNRRIFIFGNAAALALNLAIYALADHFAVVAVLYSLLGFTLTPLASNLDSWILKCFAHRPQVYGQARSGSSLSYALFMLFYGALLGRMGYQIMPVAVTLWTVATLFLAFCQPDSPSVAPPSGEKNAPSINPRTLLRSRSFLFLLGFLLLSGLATTPVSNMKIVILNSVGGTVLHQGYDSFFMCLLQFPIFLFADHLKKIPTRLRLLLAAIGPMLMLCIDFAAVSPAMVILASVFNSMAYGILLPTTREITAASVDPALLNTANGITDAVYSSFAGVISLLYVGAVIDHFGVRVMLGLCIAIQFVPILLALKNLTAKSDRQA